MAAQTAPILALMSLLALPSFLECGSEPSPSEAKKTEPDERENGTLVLDLPIGTQLKLDGNRADPLASQLEVDPGTHTVTLETVCGEKSDLELDVAPGKAVAVVPDPAFETASLEVNVKPSPEAPKGLSDPEGLVAKLGGQTFEFGKKVRVSACKQRLHVTVNPPWGGFMEDIEFSNGENVVRNVELAPGPDMVRIHGAKSFHVGPPEWAADDIYIDRKAVDIETFVLDRTEVTTAQYHACRKAGGCARNPRWAIATQPPASSKEPFCTTSVFDSERHPREDRENFPMNCVAWWEAEAYCKWAGKRLPRGEEWEYAARSRKESYLCPWATEEEDILEYCLAARSTSPQRVCSSEKWNSEQGICDLMSGVAEYVTKPPGYRGAPQLPDPIEGQPATHQDQHPNIGFRCAR